MIASVLLAVGSFVNSYFFGRTEIHPFFHWKLYTQPLANDGYFIDYSVYGVTKTDTIELKPTNYRHSAKRSNLAYMEKEAKQFAKTQQKNNLKAVHQLGTELDSSFLFYLVKKDSIEPISFQRDSTYLDQQIIATTNELATVQ